MTLTAQLPPQELLKTRDARHSRAGETDTTKRTLLIGVSPNEDTTTLILRVLGKYSLVDSPTDPIWSVATFAPLVRKHVLTGNCIPLVLPAFPYKSLNRIDKVLGVEPDLGEEVALARLESLCRDIKRIYAPGATVAVVNDGLNYNDITYVSDEDVWAYESSLRAIALDRGFTCLTFHSMISVLGLCEEGQFNKNDFLRLCAPMRHRLLSLYSDPDFDVEKLLQEDENYLMTYRGYLRFFEKELEHLPEIKKEPTKGRQKAVIKGISKRLIERGSIFAKVVREAFPDHVRLSIHPSSGKEKIYFPLIPQDSFSMTPWHAAVAVDVCGNFRAAHASDLRDTHVLVFKDGTPRYFRERSPLFEWDAEVEFTHRYHRSLVITKCGSGPTTLSASDKEKLVALVTTHLSVEVRGFNTDGHY